MNLLQAFWIVASDFFLVDFRVDCLAQVHFGIWANYMTDVAANQDFMF
jgi:hypothetical protein